MIVLYILLSILLILFIGIKFRKNNIISKEALRNKYETPYSKYFQYEGLACHYTDEGKGDVILLIHGLGDSFLIFNDLTPILTDKYRVLRVDLPGFGLSDIPNSFGKDEDPIDFYRNFVKTFADGLSLDKFHLMGNSLGGLVSWEFAVNNQNRLHSLCLLASAGYEMDAVKKNITQGVLHRLPKFILQNGMPFKIAKQNAAMVLNRRENRTDTFIQAHYDMINREGVLMYLLQLVSYKDLPQTDDLKKLDLPVFIAWGDRDKIVPTRHAEFFLEDISSAKKVIYEKCGHYPQVEYASDFYRDWTLFVKERS